VQQQAERGIPVVATLKEAWHLVRLHPRRLLMPMAVITIPLALIIAAVNAALFLTIWEDEELVGLGTLTSDTARPVMFGVVVLVAIDMLFAQVARAATIVAVASVVEGRPGSLTDCLDPAFTRLGGLLVLIAVIAGLLGVAFVTVIGVLALPYVMIRLGLAFDAYMIEGLGAWPALRRSWSLMHGRILRLFALVALSVVCALPILLTLSALEVSIGGDRAPQLLILTVFAGVRSAIFVPVVGFLTACTTLYYFKARERADAASPA